MRLLVVFMLCGTLAACAIPDEPAAPYHPPRITHPHGQVYTPDAEERAHIAATLRPVLGGRQPELGKVLSLTAQGGIQSCGLVRSGQGWRAFAMMRPTSGKPDIDLATPNREHILLEICAAEGMPITI
ncbi:hypothetical protein A7A08_00925 [Methyloligella halotolerans]|uniref:Lipoprotein n=1 Tax=Methyloligella halotolerans TaxID=1177755 RepID=A0A1E2RZX3_9HYPH|nr:hypothetical protein [Methyloligella halotolerans]ODA67761.1 hypothetical protein A7A08_00925 [Methyloligella halotolerans]